jgi:hypothetical protein
MSLSLLRALTLVALLTFSAAQAIATTPEAVLARIEQAAERTFQAALLLRQSTSVEEFETRLSHAKSSAGALSAECQALLLLLPDEPDDLRFEPARWRQTADALLTQARFAELALYDLERAIAEQDHRRRTRALRELEGGLRFIRLEAAELGSDERQIDGETGWQM